MNEQRKLLQALRRTARNAQAGLRTNSSALNLALTAWMSTGPHRGQELLRVVGETKTALLSGNREAALNGFRIAIDIVEAATHAESKSDELWPTQ
jgi:hypothetical protein